MTWKFLSFRATYTVQESSWAREAPTWSLPGKSCFGVREVTWEVGGVWERYGGISCMIICWYYNTLDETLSCHYFFRNYILLFWVLNDCAYAFQTL